MIKKALQILSLSLALSFVSHGTSAAMPLSEKLSGRILLQVEQNGEAWYVRTDSNQRMFLGRAEDAFRIMSSVGVGVEDDYLQKIEIDAKSLFSLGKAGLDEDKDGLNDDFEVFYSTNINNPDTDGDGFNDYEEILNGYNPNGLGKITYDQAFSQMHAGKILLQVEQNGEAWYINPVTLKRHFLGHPHDAFKLMRELGLGITDKDLSQIQVSAPSLLNDGDILTNLSGQINLSKSTYRVGEKFLGGEVELTYNGPPITAVVVQGIRKNNETTIYTTGVKGLFEELDFMDGKKKSFAALQSLQAFNFEQGGFLFHDSFIEPGEYHYVLEVYNCSQSKSLPITECSPVDLKNISEFEPIFSIEQTVEVTN